MKNFVTEQMLEAVEKTKKSAKIAEEEMEERKREIDNMTRSRINLNEGTAVSQVADITSSLRKAMDTFYASFQTLVTVLDSQCRPLLEQEPEIPAVRAVRDLIKWLNDESEIESNISVSVNASEQRDAASVRYVSSIENKAIQSFWEVAYQSLPGREDFERREKEEADREKRAAAEIRKVQYDEAAEKKKAAQEQYLIDYETWKTTVAEVESQRSTMLNNLEEQEKKCLEDFANEKYRSTIAEIEVEKVNIQRELDEAQSALSDLGFFKIGEKNRQKKRVEELKRILSEAEEKVNTAKSIKDQEVSEIATKIKQKKEEWRSSAEKAYPMPEEPCPPGMTPEKIATEKMKDAIYETLRHHEMLTKEEVLEKCAAVRDMSIQRVSALLRVMDGDRVTQTMCKQKIYYQALPEKDPEQVAKEIKKYKEEIINYLNCNGRRTRSDISDALGLQIRTVSELTSQLYAEGKLHRTEEDRILYFEVV